MKFSLLAGSVFGLLAVILGALASHKWQATLSDSLYSALQTAVAYQFYHALALIGVGALQLHFSAQPSRVQQPLVQKWLQRSAFALVVGVVLFCGSLYALALTGLGGFGPVTPLGGMSLILGWLCLGIAVYRLQVGVSE